jgi:diacylglycerol kinase (ATP)
MVSGLKEKWVFIVNPIAGNGFGKTMVPEIRQKIRKYQIIGEVILTEGPGHASELSRLYAEKGTRYIIAVGGDGTMNEVARPLLNNKNVTTGIIPAGSGNDFSQIPGFPNRFKENDWELFFRKNEIALDVGIVNETAFQKGRQG